MINSIAINNEWLSGGASSANGPYISANHNNPMTGMVRFVNNNLEVFDGSGWQQMYSNHGSIDVSSKTRDILQWAEAKMHMEREIMQLVETNPTVADAWNSYLDAGKKLEVIMALVKEETK